VFLLALDETHPSEDPAFVRTVRGRYVRVSDLEPKPRPEMRGVILGGDKKLPYAFVYDHADAPAPVFRLNKNGAFTEAGVADNHARIKVTREFTSDHRTWLVGPNNLALSREDVRVARKIARPDDVPAGEKWIHVDLAEQVLVAYEGDRPVFATLVSSGKGAEFATPTGLYRVNEKHISITMRGPDPDHGVYEVEEVPWTLYYHDSFALHGAYWHDDFGKTRSHGCTNISPVDARWLFYWTDGVLPAGWTGLRNFHGTHVYFTDTDRDADTKTTAT
jgi:hypothetical protein